MKVLLHKSRHVVLAPDLASDEDLAGDVSVAWVAVHPDVAGVARRGRPPVYAKPVSAKELEDLDLATLPDEVQQKVKMRVAELVEEADAEPSEVVSSDGDE